MCGKEGCSKDGHKTPKAHATQAEDSTPAMSAASESKDTRQYNEGEIQVANACASHCMTHSRAGMVYFGPVNSIHCWKEDQRVLQAGLSCKCNALFGYA